MTTEDLKKKIDGLFFGLHSTNPGDINAIKDILQALAFPGENMLINFREQQDCAAFAEIAAAKEKGSLFNKVIKQDDMYYGRIVGLFLDDPLWQIGYANAEEGLIARITLLYNSVQYEGLAAIQDAENEYGHIPNITFEDGQLLTDGFDSTYLTYNGYCIIGTAVNDKVASVSPSTIPVPEGEYQAEISIEDAQKLIGLPCSVN